MLQICVKIDMNNHRILNTTHSEVDSKCEIDSVSELQIRGGGGGGEAPKWPADLWSGHVNDRENEIWCVVPLLPSPFPSLLL